jgi:hypothetical protein
VTHKESFQRYLDPPIGWPTREEGIAEKQGSSCKQISRELRRKERKAERIIAEMAPQQIEEKSSAKRVKTAAAQVARTEAVETAYAQLYQHP